MPHVRIEVHGQSLVGDTGLELEEGLQFRIEEHQQSSVWGALDKASIGYSTLAELRGSPDWNNKEYSR